MKKRAKKAAKPSRGELASRKRRGIVSPDELQKEVARLREVAAGLDAVADKMNELDYIEVEVDGVTKMERGMKELRTFVAKVEAAISKKQWLE